MKEGRKKYEISPKEFCDVENEVWSLSILICFRRNLLATYQDLKTWCLFVMFFFFQHLLSLSIRTTEINRKFVLIAGLIVVSVKNESWKIIS